MGMFTFRVTNAYFMEDFEDYVQDPAEDRIFGELPKLNVTTYLNIAMEPHNALVQVSIISQKKPRYSLCE